MSIFGQVWLWSVAAFLIGVLLTWLVLVRPAQARNRVLEQRLLAARSATTAPAATHTAERRPVAAPIRSFEPEPGLKPLEPYEPEAFQPEPVQSEPAERPESRWFDRESYGESVAAEDPSSTAPPPPSTEALPAADSAGALFEPAELDRAVVACARRIAVRVISHGEIDRTGLHRSNLAGLRSVLEPELATESTSAFREVEEPTSERGSLFDASQPEPVPDPEPPAYAFGGGAAPEDQPSPTETTQVLPKRQPRRSNLGSFESPKAIQPSMRCRSRRCSTSTAGH